MYAGNQREELSRQSLVRQAVVINATARRYFKDAADAARFVAARDAHRETHAEVAQVNFLQRIEYLTFAFGLLCIYGIDVLLFGTSAQYVASLVGGEGDLWTAVAKYVVPACFLGIEVLIALKIAKAQDDERFGFGSSIARKFWIAIGVLVALVMPLAATATAQSVGVVAESNVPVLMIAVLAIISFAAHVLVLFAGRLAQEAKAYVVFTLIDTYHARRAQRAIDLAKGRLSALNSLFIAYVHAWRAHNGQYAALPSGPFDQEVVELLRRQFPHVASGARAASFPTLVEDEDEEAS
jgi:hypothetical protein